MKGKISISSNNNGNWNNTNNTKLFATGPKFDLLSWNRHIANKNIIVYNACYSIKPDNTLVLTEFLNFSP